MSGTCATNRCRLLRPAVDVGAALPSVRRALAAIADGGVPWPRQMETAFGVDDLHDDCLGTLLAFAVAYCAGRAGPDTIGSLTASICFLVRSRHGIAL